MYSVQEREESPALIGADELLPNLHFYLLYLTVIMPRSKKNKLHTREKHHQAQGETQGLRGAKKKALPSSSSAPLQAVLQSKPAKRSCSIRRCPPKAQPTITKSVSNTKLSKGVNCKTENKKSSSKASPSKAKSQRGPLTEMSNILVQFLMQMYKMKKPIKKADMLKIIHKKYKNSFSEILSRASFNIEVVFGVDLKEVDGMKHLYALVNKMDLPYNGRVHRARGFPKTGLLMTILGVIFMNGNRATEQKIWEFLNKMKIHAGKRHFIFGEPKKLITQDFVKLKYLEYRQVPGSVPPRYEFLWGPRAYAETSKMKILQFFAKINQTIPSAFTSWYEEALQDEKERAQATIPLRADNQCYGSE
ncbi:Melanoma-associated antigen B3 [Myotis davidii]|uniref:Melanoma-associated antigen B3 n=2 Tax=Myotis davidii TaxID=225400 RepID=L5MBL7_MYODS|nr:Melanoma-associated antigen B3 [Myotis davidii]